MESADLNSNPIPTRPASQIHVEIGLIFISKFFPLILDA